MPDPMIAVTGVSGAIGGAVFHLLDRHGYRVVGLVRNPVRAPHATGPRSHIGLLQYGASNAHLALRGVDVLFMVAADESENRLKEHRALLASARRAGVRHVVYASFLGASDDPGNVLGADHIQTERLLCESGLAWTILRSSFYADPFANFARPDQTFRGPADGGRVSLVARVDVVRSAAAVLIDPQRHEGKLYELTGPEALDLDEIASHLSRALGVRYTYAPETLEEARRWRSERANRWQVEAWVSMYLSIALGRVERVTGDVEFLTGKPPLSFDRVLRHPAISPGEVLIAGEELIPGMAERD